MGLFFCLRVYVLRCLDMPMANSRWPTVITGVNQIPINAPVMIG